MMMEGWNKGGRGGREAKGEEGIHREGGSGRASRDAKEIGKGGARQDSAWTRVVGCIVRSMGTVGRVLDYMLDLGESLVSILESLGRVAGKAAKAARRKAEKQRKVVAALTRRLQTSRKRFRPRVTKSGMGRRWQKETPAGGLHQGEPGKGGRPRFFPREGIG
jgi:hypothetical protein